MNGHPSIRLLLAVSLALPVLVWAGPAAHRGRQFFGWTDWREWQQTVDANRHESVLTSPAVPCGIAWDELVASWNVSTPPGSGLVVDVRAEYPARATRYYTLGSWSSDLEGFGRRSVPGQKDADAEVQTDILKLAEPAQAFRLRLTLVGNPAGALPQLRFFGVSLADRRATNLPALPPNRAAWGQTIDVPRRSQLDYPGGEDAWCSPTSVSMVLSYWAGKLGQPGLDRDVPEVVRGVFDPEWQGTGNWPFNTAYAGSFAGMRACVTRFSDVSELEDWIAQGIPVVASVSYDRLRGKSPPRPADGHLVVCLGFAPDGSVIVNDPGTRQQVRRTFPRENLVTAWARSGNTVYLIHPESVAPPADRFGHWHREPARALSAAPPAGSGAGEAVRRGPLTARRLALVFTGHEYAEGAEAILDALSRCGAKASFFLTGDFLRNPAFKDLARRMAKAGHYVGPHSDKHLLYCSWETPARTLVTRAQFQADLEANLRELEAAGVPRAPVRWFLPAYEHANADIVRWTQESGLTLVNYTAGTRSAADYTGENDPDFVSSRAIVESVLLREKTDEHGLNGFLLLSHLGAGPGRKDKLHACLGELLEALAGRGYGFVRLDELLAPER